MAGLLNRLRRFAGDDGQPTVVGFPAIGDCHTTTNTLYGRGCSLAAVQAVAIADAIAEHPDDPVARSAASVASNKFVVEPWVLLSVQLERLGRWGAHRPERKSLMGSSLAAIRLQKE